MKINKLLVIGLLGFSAIAFSGCAKREIKNIDAQGKEIICFGDSLTFGYGAGLGEDYPTQLGKLVSLPVINTGRDGDTSTDALKRLKTEVLERHPRLVIIEFTGNDFLENVSKEATVNNIKKMTDLIYSQGAMVAIVDVSAGFFLREYRSLLSKIAREKRAIFIPQVLRGIITNPAMKSDFLHPNAQGYKIIAQRIYRAIKSYLK